MFVLLLNEGSGVSLPDPRSESGFGLMLRRPVRVEADMVVNCFCVV